MTKLKVKTSRLYRCQPSTILTTFDLALIDINKNKS